MQVEPQLAAADAGVCKQAAQWLSAICYGGQCEDAVMALLERLHELSTQRGHADTGAVLDALLLLATWCGTALPEAETEACVRALSGSLSTAKQYAHLLGVARLAGCAGAVPESCLAVSAAAWLACVAGQHGMPCQH